MKLRLHGAEQKAVVQKTENKTTGKGAALQQGSGSSTPQAAAGSLATDGRNRGKLPNVHQQDTGEDGSSPARQKKKSFSFSRLFGKKSSKSSSQPATTSAPENVRGKGNTLRELMANDGESHDQPAGASLTRSGGCRRSSLEDMAGRPINKTGISGQQPQNAPLRGPARGTTLAELLARPEECAETPPASPQGEPRLTRSGGVKRHDLADMKGREIARGDGEEPAPAHMKQQQLQISLQEGKLKLSGTNPSAINMLLSQTLGKEDQHYLAHNVSSDGSQHQLLDKQGRLFDIKSNENGYSVLHNSQSAELKSKLEQAGDAPVSLSSHNGKLQISIGENGKNKMVLSEPGSAHHAILSGVWQHPAGVAEKEGQAVCLHDDKLHLLNSSLGLWQSASDTSYSNLSRQADGKLYAVKDDQTLSNLSENQSSEKFIDKIKSFSVGKNGQVAVLADTESAHHMCLLPSIDAKPEDRSYFSLRLADTPEMRQPEQPHPEVQSVAMSNGRLFAADSEGKLHIGLLKQIDNNELPMKNMPQKVLEQHYGRNHRIEGFFTDHKGQLNVLVKDNFRQQHACPLGDDDQFHPGWNMTDTMVINNQLGLHHISPEPHKILDMAHLGSLALKDGSVHYFDLLTKGWTSAGFDCKQLKKGLDGTAYILKDGEVKRLDINQTTSSIRQGKDNFFALPHVRNKPEPGVALQGLNKSDKAQAIAVIGVNHYFALTEKGDIRSYQIKPGTQQLARQVQSLDLEGITGALKDIHVDQQHNLYAVNQDGEVFHQSREQWQSGEAGGGWKKLTGPQNKSDLQRLEMDNEHRLVATMTDTTQHQLKEGEWHPYQSPESGPLDVGTRESQAVFGRLSQGMKGVRIPGTGLTVNVSAQAAGMNGIENRKIKSKFADRVRAYVFNPTMKTPRPIKNAAYSMQHNWKGRRGLQPLYEMQGALIKQLESHNVLKQGMQPDLKSKLEKMDLGKHGETLLNDMKHFREELEQSAIRSATILGQHQGVLTRNGTANEDFRLSPTKGVVQSFNVNRSGRDLSKALEKAVTIAPPSPASENKLHTLLSDFISKGVNMSHQKADIPLGRQRDPNDQTALTKSRLILDIITLGDMHQLADKASLISGGQPDSEQIRQLRQEFDALRQKQYGDNPVKQYTDMGFTNHGALEADYDAVKAFINAFKKEHHGVNLTARTVLETHGNAELVEKLKDTLLSMGSGESMSFSRSYSAGLSSVFVPTLNRVPVPIVPGAGVALERAYNLTFGRTPGGLNVSFGRGGGVNGTIFLATGYDLMPYMTGKKTTAENASDWLSKQHKISPDFRIGGAVSASLQGTLLNGIDFKLTEDELPGFLHGLTQGTLTPTELMQKGIEHQMMQGRRLVYNVDTSAAFDLRAGIDMTRDGSKPDGVTARISAGVSGSLNLVSGLSERITETGEFGRTQTSSDNSLTFFNSASVGANLTASVGVAHGFTHDGKVTANATSAPATSVGTFPAFTSTNVSVALAMDDRTTQNIILGLKQAEPVTNHDISELKSMLKKHFRDSDSVNLLKALEKDENPDPVEHLDKLSKHFNTRSTADDDRYQAIRTLKKLVARQMCVATNSQELGSAMHLTTYTNLSRLDENGILDVLRRHIDAALLPSRADRIRSMMDNDPVLKDLIKQLQTTPFSYAIVSMELKDVVRDAAEKAMLEGKLGREELGALFQDPDYLRIKSVSVIQSATKSEGFNTPAMLLRASNSAGMSMERNIGTINFEYGRDQDTPRCFTLEGAIAEANPEVASALTGLKKEGFEMKG
ncbi:AvrE-family type 3 secretion system effector [Erwinia tracheiphila]|uniref:AvrE-family type 3 secretion system effector n=1 Tax=Erwinia tracheiphila TaxID=65700 RepID=A0A345CUS7_9GAMM|nr:AvrE-family type 3 secretion system effector [Erwinia tracheiphila]AXF77194.1 AvrE-family type 3 secretion system effector [Erwinia tracheiphila]UIA84117.1 AvrE-family type 3 secretion system effector [Erwinia tracheiphila]UIA92698.1 AvrE-family type 3 secretion system effector [Erwinia tracheiphila]